MNRRELLVRAAGALAVLVVPVPAEGREHPCGRPPPREAVEIGPGAYRIPGRVLKHVHYLGAPGGKLEWFVLTEGRDGRAHLTHGFEHPGAFPQGLDLKLAPDGEAIEMRFVWGVLLRDCDLVPTNCIEGDRVIRGHAWALTADTHAVTGRA